MNIPGLGSVTKSDNGEFRSKPVLVPVLGGEECCFIVEDYVDDPDKEAFHIAIENFLCLTDSALKDVEGDVFDYYKDIERELDSQTIPGSRFKVIKSPREVWNHVHFGTEAIVSRRRHGDKGIYISLGCGCDWEVEHGMQIVFKNGLKINKIGPYDGHLTNSDAFDNESLENVVYPKLWRDA